MRLKAILLLFLCFGFQPATRAGGEDTKEPPPAEEKLWKRDLSAGYNQASGNTRNSQLFLRLSASRKTGDEEFSGKGDIYYSSTDRKMDSQKWYAMLRYAFSFREKKWFNFYKLESDHDRFANINYRIVPSAGVGYWFSDTENWKAAVDCGLGLEHTEFRAGAGDSSNAILIARGFLARKLLENLEISQEVILYPALGEGGEYRFHSETMLISYASEKLSLRLSLIDDYNSAPPPGVRENDLQFISLLSYSF